MKRTDISEIFPDATAEQLDKLMALHGTDINTINGRLATALDRVKTLETEAAGFNKDEFEKAKQQAAALKTELDAMKSAETIRVMRDKVAAAQKIPAALLTGDTEDACNEQAKAILEFAKSNGYPAVRDGGDAGGAPRMSASQAAWADLSSQMSK